MFYLIKEVVTGKIYCIEVVGYVREKDIKGESVDLNISRIRRLIEASTKKFELNLKNLNIFLPTTDIDTL